MTYSTSPHFYGKRSRPARAVPPGTGTFRKEELGPLVLWRFNPGNVPARIYFTTRSGGSSKAPYESLNLGFHAGDDPEAVRGNRALLAGELGLKPGSLTSPRQRHTALAAVADDPGQAGSGAFVEDSLFDPCDALMTRLENVPILLHFADCVPVVLCGEGNSGPAVAVIHAGRKGLVAGVVESAVSLFKERLGVASEAAVAAIGPAIGPCCYEVDSQTASAFRERFGARAASGGNHLDLRLATASALKAAGVTRDNTHHLDICTSCDDSFFSYRRDGVTGRHGAVAWLA